MKPRLFAILTMIVPCVALAAGWGLTRSYGSFATEQACKDAAASQPAGAYLCTNVLQSTVTVPVVVVPPPTAGTWTRIASENQPFTVGTNQVVRFGRSPTFVQKTMTGAGQCTVAFFGSDPVPGQGKFCDVLDGSGTVTPPPTARSATISWVAPMKNADGTPLVDLAGYRLRNSATVDVVQLGASATSYTYATIPDTLTRFTLTAIDTSGNESTPVEVSK